MAKSTSMYSMGMSYQKALKYLVLMGLLAAGIAAIVFSAQAAKSMKDSHDKNENPTSSADGALVDEVEDFQKQQYNAMIAFGAALILSIVSLHFRM